MRVVVAWGDFEVAHSFSHFCQVARKYVRLVRDLVKITQDRAGIEEHR
jgi:hypothetical protein